jgi:alpha-glucosidase
MLLTLRGTPFLYQGEELGLENAQVSSAEQVDPGGRDGQRAPLPWEAEAPHGWHGARPWLPFPPQASELSVERQWRDPHSTLHLYRRLLVSRKASAALRLGAWCELPSSPEILAYRRTLDEDERVVCINFADRPLAFEVEGTWQIEVASDGEGEGMPFPGRVLSEQALILARRTD